jgi:hypothetical protein
MADGLRFRVWVDGKLTLEEWIDDPEKADPAAGRHAVAALASGKPWLVEIFDPDLPEEEAYIRFGSDPAGMVEPIPLEPPIDLARSLGIDPPAGEGP